MRQTETKADDVSRSVSPIKHGTTRVLAHEVARQLLAERRIAKLKAHLEQAEIRALEKDIRKQVLKAAELKFEAAKQARSAGNTSSAAIESASLAMPKSTSRAVTVALKDDEQQTEAKHARISTSHIHERHRLRVLENRQILHRKGNAEQKLQNHRTPWFESSSIFDAGSREDQQRQLRFHEQLLQIRKHVAAEHLRQQKQLAKQHLLYKLRALRTARHLEHSTFSDQQAEAEHGNERRGATSNDPKAQGRYADKTHKTKSYHDPISQQAAHVRKARNNG